MQLELKASICESSKNMELSNNYWPPFLDEIQLTNKINAIQVDYT